METKTCLNCNIPFTLSSSDFDFYAKIKVPPPTWCPTCRCVRRMVHRNERHLFNRKCDISGKDIISIYRPECPYTICDKDYYFSDEYDPFKYGAQYDSTKSFFPQFYEFAKKVPLTSLFVRNSENCEYNQDMGGASNCFLCYRTHKSQNMYHTYRGNKSSNCVDCFQVVEACDFLYECVNATSCNNSSFLHYCEKCSDSAFLYNCVACIDCFMCTDLRNKQNCYKNQQYSREEYKKIVESYKLESFDGQQKALQEFESFLKTQPRKNLTISKCDDVSGDTIYNSKNCHNVFNVRGSENCSHIWDSMTFKDSMDAYSGASVELVYEATATTGHSNNCHFCVRVYDGSYDCEYSWFLQNCSNCFACISLSNKSYCIFNVQYSKEEYFELLEKIKNNMKEHGEYGEFFPLYTSPFPYNNTVAQDYYPLDKQKAESQGFLWGQLVEKNYIPTLLPQDLPNTIQEVSESITSEIIACEDKEDCAHGCTKAYRISIGELEYYKRKNIPLPRKCPNCRYYRRLNYRNPPILRDTVCMCNGTASNGNTYINTANHMHGGIPCGKKIQTTIRKEDDCIIYCEECYKQEMY